MNRQVLAAGLIELLEGPLADLGYELLDVRIFKGGGRVTLRVYVDAEGGVSVDDCARASRTVGILLEEADLLETAYLIEVTSPGVRRPLRTPAHFRAAVGQDVILKVAADGGTRTLKGRLLAADEAELTLETAAARSPDEGAREADVLRVGTGAIREANLDPEFDVQALIHADRSRRKQDRKLAREARRERKRRSRES